jgi:hypothetical protein
VPSSPPPAPDVTPPKPVETPKVVASALAPAASSSSVELPGDHSIPAIASGTLVAFAAVTFAMRGNVDEREVAKPRSTSIPAPASSSGCGAIDLSIPCHAVAQLAYEKSDKFMPYDKFQENMKRMLLQK